MIQAYDADGHYLLADRPEDDPAYPGITPEPQEDAVVFLGQEPIPVARTFLRDAEPRHYDQIRAMLLELPRHRLTRIVGYGDAFDGDWRACNEGPHGQLGDWTIHRDPRPAAPPPVARRTPPQPLDLPAHDRLAKTVWVQAEDR